MNLSSNKERSKIPPILKLLKAIKICCHLKEMEKKSPNMKETPVYGLVYFRCAMMVLEREESGSETEMEIMHD